MREILPALFTTSLAEYRAQVESIKGLVKKIHLDVMDGRFVPNTTTPLPDVKKVSTNFEFQAHLMVYYPEKYIKKLRKLKVKEIIFHAETTKKYDSLVKICHANKIKAGLAINPKTPVSKIARYLKKIDFLLVMTVHPGFSGQKMIHRCLSKIKAAKEINRKLVVGVDGGVNQKNISKVKQAGADFICAASAVFEGNQKENLEKLKKLF